MHYAHQACRRDTDKHYASVNVGVGEFIKY